MYSIPIHLALSTSTTNGINNASASASAALSQASASVSTALIASASASAVSALTSNEVSGSTAEVFLPTDTQPQAAPVLSTQFFGLVLPSRPRLLPFFPLQGALALWAFYLESRPIDQIPSVRSRYSRLLSSSLVVRPISRSSSASIQIVDSSTISSVPSDTASLLDTTVHSPPPPGRLR